MPATVPSIVRPSRRAGILAVALCAGAFLRDIPARAAAPDPDQAKAMQDQIQAWDSNLAGPYAAKLPKPPVRVTAAGDHYELSIPYDRLLSVIPGLTLTMPRPATLHMTPLDNNKWQIDHVDAAFPWQLSVRTRIAKKKVAMDMHIDVHDHSGHGVIDPTFASPSAFESRFHGLEFTLSRPDEQRKETIDRATVNYVMTPRTASTVDVSEKGSVDGVAAEDKFGPHHVVKVDVHHVDLEAHLDALDRVKLMSAATRILAWAHGSDSFATAMATDGHDTAGGKPGSSDADAAHADAVKKAHARAMANIHALLLMARDIVRAGEARYTLKAVQASYDGHSGGAEQVQFGMGGAALDGKLGAHVDLAVDALSVADLPPPLVALMPKHLALKPYVAGISVADVTKMALDATAPDSDMRSPPDIMKLFQHGDVAAGINGLAIEVAGASVAGEGKLVFTAPRVFTGKAAITATNFDKLMQAVQQVPAAARVVPVLVMARGLGRPENGSLIWDVEVANNDVKVNGTDLRALAGGQK